MTGADRHVLERHVRYVAADPLLDAYHRDREARVVERIARRLELDGHDDAAIAGARELANRYREGATL